MHDKELPVIEGYNANVKKLSILKLNIMAVLLTLAALYLVTLLYSAVWNEKVTAGKIFDVSGISFPAIVAVIVIGIILHEMIHGFFFSLFTLKGMRSVKIGVLWKKLTPYCHCKEPVKRYHFIIATIAPMIILGIIPLSFGFVMKNFLLLQFGIVFVIAALGDIMLISLLIKEKNNSLIYDLPDEVGFAVYQKN